MQRRALAVGVAVPLALGLIGAALVARRGRPSATSEDLVPLAAKARAAAETTPAPPPVSLASLDVTKMAFTQEGAATVPLEPPGGPKRVARLTIDPNLQRITTAVMKMHHIPEASVVLMDVETGNVLVYASHVEKGPARDLCAEATAPAASVFKVVTGSALVESGGVTPDHKECFSGGEQKILEQDLQRDPKRDRWCATLSGAMGRSINTIFARLALEKLPKAALEETARNLGFGGSLPFDVALQPSALRFPDDALGYARTAAGFWNTTMSPVHAAWLSATVARGGEPVRPRLVADVTDEGGKVLWTSPSGVALKRAIKPETAHAVSTMMDSTVSDGTSYRAFHDPKGGSFLPGVTVAGKTGTLTDPGGKRFYTWFTGFAPSRPYVAPPDTSAAVASPRQVAVGVLVVNEPTWSVKANVLAREVLRAYFAEQKLPSVTVPMIRASQPSTTPGTKHRRQRGS
jgi:cell division protein FtsI/penicillin-binding protein 2